MSLLVRPFQPGDVPTANCIVNHYIRETHIHFASEPARDEQFLGDWRASQPRYPWLTATLDGRFAGYAKGGPWRAREAYRSTVETAVYIDPACHRRGVGLAVMTALLDELSRREFRTAIAGVALPNDASIALHEKLGFASVGTFHGVGVKFGRSWDVGFWQRCLC
jgi:phosphinothricin acetyltransferase